MKKLRNTVVTAVAAMALAPLGMAQEGNREGREKKDRLDGDREHPERMEGLRPGGNPFVAMLDTDKNGELSAEEIVLAPAALAKMDKNSDGKLSADELRPPQRDGDRERDRPEVKRPDGDRPEGKRPDGDRPESKRPDSDRPERPEGARPNGDRPPGGFGERLKMMDKNENGNLEAEEIPEQFRDRMMENLDKNGDSVISKAELEAGAEEMRERFNKGGDRVRPDGDAGKGKGDRDGERDRPEGGRPDGQRPPGDFGDRLKMMDKNENGNLEAEEIPEQFRDRMMDRLDKNGDSVISKAELEVAAEEMRERFGKGGDRARPDGGAGKGKGDRDGGGAVKPKRPPLEE